MRKLIAQAIPSAHNIVLSNLVRSAGGLSRENWSVDATWTDDTGLHSHPLMLMRDAAGNTVKSFGSWGEAVKAGDKIKIKATVNKHTYYNGRAETIVNRVRPA